MQNISLKTAAAIALLSTAMSQQASAAIALDRTRVIFDGGQSSVSLNLSNQNKQLPYLAQGWLEDEQGNKIQSPLVVLPPVQRIEPGKPSQIKIQALPAAKQLPQDRESVLLQFARDPAEERQTEHVADRAANAHQAVLPADGDCADPRRHGDAVARATDTDAPGRRLSGQ